MCSVWETQHLRHTPPKPGSGPARGRSESPLRSGDIPSDSTAGPARRDERGAWAPTSALVRLELALVASTRAKTRARLPTSPGPLVRVRVGASPCRRLLDLADRAAARVASSRSAGSYRAWCSSITANGAQAFRRSWSGSASTSRQRGCRQATTWYLIGWSSSARSDRPGRVDQGSQAVRAARAARRRLPVGVADRRGRPGAHA